MICVSVRAEIRCSRALGLVVVAAAAAATAVGCGFAGSTGRVVPTATGRREGAGVVSWAAAGLGGVAFRGGSSLFSRS